MIKPTPQTLECHRVQNESFSRLGYIRLDKNENTVGYPKKFVQEMLAGISPEMLSSYPEPFQLHERLARFLNLSKDRILLASGSDAAIKNCFEAFVDKGDKVITLFPTYAMVGIYAQLFGAKVVQIGYDDNLKLDFERLSREIQKGARLLYIANPNSPTGTLIGKERLRFLCEECRKREIVFLIDEAYYYFCSETALDLIDEFPNIVVTRTFSKALGLASIRLGYLVTSPEIADWLSRWRPVYEINSFAQYCGSFILDHWESVEEYVREVLKAREWFSERVKAVGLETFPSFANFLLVKFPDHQIPRILEEFKRQGILIKGGGSMFPLSQTLRFSLGVKEQMERCINILEQLEFGK